MTNSFGNTASGKTIVLTDTDRICQHIDRVGDRLEAILEAHRKAILEAQSHCQCGSSCAKNGRREVYPYWADQYYPYTGINTTPLFKRGKKHKKNDLTEQVHKSAEDLAERGQANLIENPAPKPGEEGRLGKGSLFRRLTPKKTATKTAHSERHDDARLSDSQDWIGEVSNTRKELTSDTQDAQKSVENECSNAEIVNNPIDQEEQHRVEQGEKTPKEWRNWWARIRAKYPKPFAEFLAVLIAVFMGLAANVSVNLSAKQNDEHGTYETSCWAWGLAWMFGIYVSGGVSGAHMNPAISISLSLFRGFPWQLCFVYIAVQFLASIAAGALVYGIYWDCIRHADPTMTETAKAFFSTPKAWVSPGMALFDQVVGSAIMMIAVFALSDRNTPPRAGMHALVFGLLLTTLRFALGYNVGSSLNPASDFGPRVILWAAGYRGPETFGTSWWYQGPWIATIIGSVIGCTLYDGLIFDGPESPINHRFREGFKKRVQGMKMGIRGIQEYFHRK